MSMEGVGERRERKDKGKKGTAWAGRREIAERERGKKDETASAERGE